MKRYALALVFGLVAVLMSTGVFSEVAAAGGPRAQIPFAFDFDSTNPCTGQPNHVFVSGTATIHQLGDQFGVGPGGIFPFPWHGKLTADIWTDDGFSGRTVRNLTDAETPGGVARWGGAEMNLLRNDSHQMIQVNGAAGIVIVGGQLVVVHTPGTPVCHGRPG